jgi:hypothetical protein
MTPAEIIAKVLATNRGPRSPDYIDAQDADGILAALAAAGLVIASVSHENDGLCNGNGKDYACPGVVRRCSIDD